MKIVTNRTYGGFGLSDEAFGKVLTRKGITFFNLPSNYDYLLFSTISEEAYNKANDKEKSEARMDFYSFERNDPDLVAVVEEMGEEANGEYAFLEVTEIPDDVEWEISEYDGWETIHEKHRSW